MSKLSGLDIYTTAIPMRSFEHAAAARHEAQAVVVRAQFADGSEGWGETLPRPYVTGEDVGSVVQDLQTILLEAGRNLPLEGPGEAAAIPDMAPDGRRIIAGACALRLAIEGRFIGRVRGADRKWPAAHGISARVSGVLGSSDPARTARRLRLMRWFGLRDFKLKLGLGEDLDRRNLLAVRKQIGPAIARGQCTLRVDVNGGWDAASTPARVAALVELGVCAVEQPVFCPAGELAELSRACALPLMADESLLTIDDAKALLKEPARVWWNIRISKNGGLWSSLELARLAAQSNVTFTVGSMVGESSILSAAQRRLLEMCPNPRFVEGNYGRFLLADDLTRRSLRFGYGGRLKPLAGEGLGVQVDRRKLQRYGTLVKSIRL